MQNLLHPVFPAAAAGFGIWNFHFVYFLHTFNVAALHPQPPLAPVYPLQPWFSSAYRTEPLQKVLHTLVQWQSRLCCLHFFLLNLFYAFLLYYFFSCRTLSLLPHFNLFRPHLTAKKEWRETRFLAKILLLTPALTMRESTDFFFRPKRVYVACLFSFSLPPHSPIFFSSMAFSLFYVCVCAYWLSRRLLKTDYGFCQDIFISAGRAFFCLLTVNRMLVLSNDWLCPTFFFVPFLHSFCVDMWKLAKKKEVKKSEIIYGLHSL